MTRASTYKDALKGFIVGYQEDMQQVWRKNEDAKLHKDIYAAKEQYWPLQYKFM